MAYPPPHPHCKFGAKTFLIDHLIVYDLPVVYIGIESINHTYRQKRGESRHDKADMESRQLTQRIG